VRPRGESVPDDAQTEFTLLGGAKVTSWSMAVLRLLGTLAVIASAARGFVAFAAWRRSFVNRLIGADPNPQELS
jgi:hypothetical protein